MEHKTWESQTIADKWGELESSSGKIIAAKSNYYYPVDPSHYVGLLRRGNIAELTSVEIWPNNYCNQSCKFCNSDVYGLKGHQSLPFDVLSKLISDLADLDNKVVRFSGGGEPHLYEKMAEIIELIAVRNMASFFITNGSVLSEELVRSLASFANLVRFSFNGGNQADYLEAHGRDHFHEAIRNMQRMVSERKKRDRENSLLLGATFILTPQNFTHLSDAVGIVRDCGFNYMLIRPRSPFPAHLADEAYDVLKEQLMLGQSLASENFYVGGKLRKLDGAKPQGKLCRACYVTNFRAYVAADGNVFSCFDGICNRRNSFGNVKEKSFKDIWGGEDHLALRKRLGQGDFFDFCHSHCGNTDFNRSIDEIKEEIELDPDVRFRKIPYDWIRALISDVDCLWF